jgi:protein CpxP
MLRHASSSPATGVPSPGRPVRGFLLAMGVALASGVGLAAWSATGDLSPEPDVMVPRGPLLDRLLDQAQASPAQRAQSHQIFDAADAELRRQRGAGRADRARMAQLFAQPTIDAAAVEAVRGRIERRHDLESRRATQTLIDVGVVLTPRQRQAISSQLADGPRPFAGIPHPPAALAAND